MFRLLDHGLGQIDRGGDCIALQCRPCMQTGATREVEYPLALVHSRRIKQWSYSLLCQATKC